MPGRKFTTYLEDKLIKDLKKIAIDKETSVSQILNDLATVYVEKEKASTTKYD
jgi:hypothetical protein